jgi:hypothetical protein
LTPAHTLEFAAETGMDDELRAALVAEPRSTVTFELASRGPLTRLTVTHGGFRPGSTLRDMIGAGWRELLSSLKTLLETSEPLPVLGVGTVADLGEHQPVHPGHVVGVEGLPVLVHGAPHPIRPRRPRTGDP